MNKLFISIVLIFVVVAGTLLFQASRTGTSDVRLPSDLSTRAANTPINRIRVAGKVADLPIDYRVEPTIELRFSIEDPGTGAKKPGVVPVVYNGVKPDMFASGRDVIIDGDFEGGTLIATKLLTQCPSKYQAPNPGQLYNPGTSQKP